jgi:pimeloyl-ACP methyl ester carboxylesterase
MAKKISGAELAEIPGVYHHLVLDAADAFVALLDRFLLG